MYTIWAIFGGFILHFLLSNYLTVLLKPSWEEPVDTAADLNRRNLIPVVPKTQKIYIQIFANSPDPEYQYLSQRVLVANTSMYKYTYMREARQGYVYTVMSPRRSSVRDPGHYSSEVVKGRYHFPGSIANKKWPLKKVFQSSSMKQY